VGAAPPGGVVNLLTHQRLKSLFTMSDSQDELRRSAVKEEIAEWWRKVYMAFPTSGETLVHAGYVGSKASISRDVCEIWTTDPDNSAAIRGIETNQTHFANYHCSIHGEPTSNEPSWEARLSCGKIKHYIEKCGVIILRAVLHSNLAEVAGYISGNIKICPETEARFVHVNHICVLPQHRNTGIGRMLWEAFLLYFESEEPGITREVQLEVYMKNDVARKWYESLGFADSSFKDGCRSMKRSCEDNSVAISAKSKAASRACQMLPDLLQQVEPHLNILAWEVIVIKLEDQVQSVLNTQASSSPMRPLEVGGVFTGSWQIKVNGNSKIWGRAFVGPLGMGFFDVRAPEVSHMCLQAVRIDGIGGPVDGTFTINNATLSQVVDGNLEWKWGRNGKSVWIRDTVAKSPLPLIAPTPGATVAGEFGRAVKLIRTSLAAARNELWPVDETLDKELQMWLRRLLEPRVRLPQAKLLEAEAKLDRLERKYGGADSLKRNSSEMSENSEYGSEITKSGIKRFRSIPMKLGLVSQEPVDV